MTNISSQRKRTRRPVVLIVQPDDDSRDMYVAFLQAHRFETLEAANATEALRLAERAAVLVTGIRLHAETTGLDLISRVRHEPQTRHMPIIVVTANAFKSDRDKAFAAGCDAFLPMPCAPLDLLREVRRMLLRRVRPRAAKAARPADAAGRARPRRRKQ